MGAVFLRKYNTLTVTGTTAIRIPIVKRAVVDFAVSADWTPAAGDVKIAVDGTAPANVTNLPTATASGNTAYWEFVLTAAELSCKQAIVMVADAATKAVEDQAFIVETFGNASAMYQADLSAANLPANVAQWSGANVSSPATAGIPEVNVKNVNNVSAASVTTINANQGTTQPINFTGTAGSALAKSDMVDIAGSAISASTAQLGVNVVNFGGSAGTFASGRPEVNTTHFGGTISPATAGFVGPDWGHVNAPTTTVGLTGTTISTGQAITSVSGSVGSVTGAVGSVTGSVASVTGNVGGNVVGSVASVTAGVTVTTNNDKTGYALSATGSAALTEGYPADGSTGTIAELLYLILANVSQYSIASTTLTLKKLDGTTLAGTYTLDDATNPTSRVRAS